MKDAIKKKPALVKDDWLLTFKTEVQLSSLDRTDKEQVKTVVSIKGCEKIYAVSTHIGF